MRRRWRCVVRVLLVEDESRLAETMRRGLAAEGFVVDVEHDGVAGLAAAATGDFDVVVHATEHPK